MRIKASFKPLEKLAHTQSYYPRLSIIRLKVTETPELQREAQLRTNTNLSDVLQAKCQHVHREYVRFKGACCVQTDSRLLLA